VAVSFIVVETGVPDKTTNLSQVTDKQLFFKYKQQKRK
jgi:hypothetical protein